MDQSKWYSSILEKYFGDLWVMGTILFMSDPVLLGFLFLTVCRLSQKSPNMVYTLNCIVECWVYSYFGY